MTIDPGMLNQRVLVKRSDGVEKHRRVRINNYVDATAVIGSGYFPGGALTMTMRRDSYTRQIDRSSFIVFNGDEYKVTDMQPRWDGSDLMDLTVEFYK